MIKLYKAILYIIYNMILKTIELNVTLSVVFLLMLRKFIYTKREKILFYTSILALLLLYTLSYYCIDFVHSFYVLITLEYIFYIYNNNLQYNNLILFFICMIDLDIFNLFVIIAIHIIFMYYEYNNYKEYEKKWQITLGSIATMYFIKYLFYYLNLPVYSENYITIFSFIYYYIIVTNKKHKYELKLYSIINAILILCLIYLQYFILAAIFFCLTILNIIYFIQKIYYIHIDMIVFMMPILFIFHSSYIIFILIFIAASIYKHIVFFSQSITKCILSLILYQSYLILFLNELYFDSWRNILHLYIFVLYFLLILICANKFIHNEVTTITKDYIKINYLLQFSHTQEKLFFNLFDIQNTTNINNLIKILERYDLNEVILTEEKIKINNMIQNAKNYFYRLNNISLHTMISKINQTRQSYINNPLNLSQKNVHIILNNNLMIYQILSICFLIYDNMIYISVGHNKDLTIKLNISIKNNIQAFLLNKLQEMISFFKIKNLLINNTLHITIKNDTEIRQYYLLYIDIFKIYKSLQEYIKIEESFLLETLLHNNSKTNRTKIAELIKKYFTDNILQ